MINPFTMLLGQAQNNPAMQQIGKLFGMVSAAQNPQAAVNQMSQNNPMMQQAMDFIRQNGGDARAAFYAMAKQKGVDPNQAIQQARDMMKMKTI